jgi:hypothetical protein
MEKKEGKIISEEKDNNNCCFNIVWRSRNHCRSGCAVIYSVFVAWSTSQYQLCIYTNIECPTKVFLCVELNGRQQ